MTEFEKRQPSRVFINAGKRAYLMFQSITSNPYKDQPFHDLWIKGFKTEQHRVAFGRPVRKNPYQLQPFAGLWHQENRALASVRTDRQQIEEQKRRDQSIRQLQRKFAGPRPTHGGKRKRHHANPR